MPETAEPAWYVFKTKPRSERLVADGLASHAVRTYLPLVPRHQASRPRPLGLVRGAEPLFPGYVFIYLDPASPQWVRARSYPGVSYVLGFDGRPVPLPGLVVENIRDRVDRSWSRVQAGLSFYEAGDRVRIVDGPLAGLEAVFERPLSGRERCRVLLTLAHRLVPVALPYTAFEKSDGSGEM